MGKLCRYLILFSICFYSLSGTAAVFVVLFVSVILLVLLMETCSAFELTCNGISFSVIR